MKNIFFIFIGLGDFITGILLLFAPEKTFLLLSIPQPFPPLFYIRFIGAFVGSVGLVYFIPNLKKFVFFNSINLDIHPVLFITALIRTCIGFFIIFSFLFNGLESPWLRVGSYDLLIAAIQYSVIFKKSRRTHA